MAECYDAIIIGGGHNGLVCGAYLAKAGVKTLVLERRHLLGGAAVTEEVFPGYRMSVASYVMSLLSPRVINDLELRRFGLVVLPANNLFSPLENGDHIFLHDGVAKTQEEFAGFSRKDAEAYPLFNEHLQDAVKVVRALPYETPPDITKRDWRSIKNIAELLWRNRRFGSHAYRIVDLMTQSVYEYLSRWFENETIKALLAYYASIGTGASSHPGGAVSGIPGHNAAREILRDRRGGR